VGSASRYVVRRNALSSADREGGVAALRALPFGRRLRRRVRPLRGWSNRGVRTRSPLCARYEEGPLSEVEGRQGERGIHSALRAPPCGRLRLAVRCGVCPCGASRLALRATASPSCPPAARVVEPAGVLVRSPLSARYEKGPLAGAFA